MSFFNPGSSGALAAGDVLNTIGDIMDKAKVASKHAKTSSLVDVTSVARVEPLAIIDSDSMNSENIGQVMMCAHNIFTGYYLQAISLLGDVGKINVVKTLDKLNPNRKPDTSGFISQIITDVATENYGTQDSTTLNFFNLGLEDYKLPTYGIDEYHLPTYAVEAITNEEKEKIKNLKNDLKEELKEQKSELKEQRNKLEQEEKEEKARLLNNSIKVSDKALATAQEMSNLSVGKLIDVTITDQGNTVTVPIAIRLIANELPQSPMLRLLSLQGLDRSLTERFWKWRAGRISFIKDLILMQDLIREDKKAMMIDKHGIIDEIMRRARNNKLAGFFSKNASMNEAANIVIFSEETAKQLKLQYNIDVDNFKQRQTIFDSSYSMILVKVDREWERVTFYINGMPLPSSMSKNELKSNSSKGSGTDLVEIFTALKKSDTPSLF